MMIRQYPTCRANGLISISAERSRTRARAALCGATMLFVTGVAWAEGGDPVAARAQLRQGYALKQQGKCKEAVPFLQESARLDRQPKTLLNLGDCELALGQLGAAQTHFVEARDLARQQGNNALRTIGEKRLQDVEKRMPRLTIELAKDAPADTVVLRDGVEVGAVSLRSALPIDTGRHVVVARGGGFERQFEITLAEGENRKLEITPIGGKAIAPPVVAAVDKPAAAPTEAQKKEATRNSAFKIEGPTGDRAESGGGGGQRTIGYVTLGLGAVGLGAGGFFAARTYSKRNELADMCTAESPCDDVQAELYENKKETANNARMLSIVGFGVGGAAAITGLILVLTAPKSTSSAWQVAPAIGQGSMGAVVAGRW
jgi:hypothetical protein